MIVRQIRYYQEEAIEAIYKYFASKTGNPIVAMPTGTGKSLVIAEFIKSVFAHFQGQKIICLTHVKELIGQNYKTLLEQWPLAPSGIYSAGLNRKEVRPITFAGIASVVKKAAMFGHIDLILVDECHLISPHDETQYQNFIADVQRTNPNVKVVGFTATPYRLGQGLLTQDVETKRGPRPSLFTDICFDITGLTAFNRLIAEGFLCTLIPKRTTQQIDLSQVATVGGDYNLRDLQAFTDRAAITKKAVDEIIEQGLPQDRKQRHRWLVFATGIEHSDHVATELNSRGIEARSIHSESPSKERDEAVKWFKRPADGKPRALVNNGVFTTGFDCPEIDLIAVLRATKSPGLWVQMLGRGTRPAEGKTDCLVLDFAGNTKRLGPINDPILPRAKGKGKGDAPVKTCEACGAYNHASVRFCVFCGNLFPALVKFQEKAAEEEIIKSEQVEIHVFKVDTITYREYIPKSVSKPPSLKVQYGCGPIRSFSEWICLEHDGFAGKKARDWWRERMDGEQPPATVEQAYLRCDELKVPTHIRVWTNSPHPRIMAYDFTGTAFGTQAADFIENRKPLTDQYKEGDDIPF